MSFERLLARLGDIELAIAPDELHYAPSFIIRGIESLPLRFREISNP